MSNNGIFLAGSWFQTRFFEFHRDETTSAITYREVRNGFAKHLWKNSLMNIIYLPPTKENRCAEVFSVCV